MVVATQLSELMTECNDGKIVIDLFTVMQNGVTKGLLQILGNSFLELPAILIFLIVGIVGSIIPGLQYWGGFGLGQVARRMIVG